MSPPLLLNHPLKLRGGDRLGIEIALQEGDTDAADDILNLFRLDAFGNGLNENAF